MEDRVRRAKGLLEKVCYRPKPLEVQRLNFKDIDAAAKELGYPIYDLGPFFALQKLALGLLQDKVAKVFKDHEKDKPIYVIFGRDGVMVYDAMATLAMNSELAERVRLATLSKPQADEWRKEADLNKKREIQEGILGYLAQEKVRPESLRAGHFVLIDSGNMGSMFDFVLEVCGTSREKIGDRFAGCLISRADKSSYQEVGWIKEPDRDDFFQEFYRTFVKNWEDLEDWPVNFSEMYLWSLARKTNWALASYLHLQPKYHRRTAKIEKVAGVWQSLPAEKNRCYPLQSKEPWEPLNITEPVWHPNHASAIDPVAATKLQMMTVEYFSKFEVRGVIVGV